MSTPPKSQMSTSLTRRRVARCAASARRRRCPRGRRVASGRPPTCTWSAVQVERRAGDHLPEPRRGILLARQPQLEPGAALAAAAVVDGRDAGLLDLEELAVLDQPGAHLLVAVADRAARPPRERQQRVPLVDERRDAADGVELLPAAAARRSPRPCRARPRAARPPRRARAHTRARDAAEVRRRRDGLELERERVRAAPRASRRPSARPRAPPAGRPACGPRTGSSRPTAPSRGCRGRRRRRTARAPERSPLEPARGRVVVLAARCPPRRSRAAPAPKRAPAVATRRPSRRTTSRG